MAGQSDWTGWRGTEGQQSRLSASRCEAERLFRSLSILRRLGPGTGSGMRFDWTEKPPSVHNDL